MAETEAQLVAAQAELRTAGVQRRRILSAQEIEALIAGLGDLVRVLKDATPQARQGVYQTLGVRLVYRPDKQEIRVEADLDPDRIARSTPPDLGKRYVSEGRSRPIALGARRPDRRRAPHHGRGLASRTAPVVTARARMRSNPHVGLMLSGTVVPGSKQTATLRYRCRRAPVRIIYGFDHHPARPTPGARLTVPTHIRIP